MHRRLIRLSVGGMKWLSLFFVLSIVSLAQPRRESVTGTYTFDANGNRVLATESRASSGEGSNARTEMIRNLNGEFAPLEKVEEKVVSQSDTTKIVERVVRSFDASGNPGQVRKVVTTERKNADGSIAVESATYNGDVNGGYSLLEKQQKTSRTVGDVTKYESVITRATSNGEEVVEQQHGSIVATKERSREDVTVERRDLNGNLQLATRSTIEKEETPGVVKEKAVTYYNDGGQLLLSSQTVSETKTSADGSSLKQVNVYGASSPGQPVGDTPQFREQQITAKKPGANNTVTETLSIRRPNVGDASVLGPPIPVSERTCTGQCNTP